jgi:hypothetical protein
MKPLTGNNIIIAISLLAGLAIFAAAFFSKKLQQRSATNVMYSEPFNNGDMVWESLPNNFIFSNAH